MKSNLAILGHTELGIIAIVSILSILTVHVIFLPASIITLGALFFLFITILFLHNPLYGFISILITRTSIDFLSSRFSISIVESIDLNIASLFAIISISLYTLFLLKNKKYVSSIPLIIPFLLFIFMIIISHIYSIDKVSTLKETLRVSSIFFTYLTAYLLCMLHTDHKKIIINSILLSSIIPISFALFQFTTKTGMTDATGLDGRLFGTFAEANGFASFMLIIITLLLYKTFSSNKNSKSDSSLILLVLSTLLMLLTFSRGGWLALLVIFGVFGAIKKPKILLIFSGIFIILFFTSPKIHERIEDVYNPPSDSSVRWRIRQWTDVIDTWKLSPIYGHGGGTEIVLHIQEHSYFSGDPYTHNDLLKTLQEIGVIGAALFVLLMSYTIILFFKNYRSNSNENNKLFILLVLLLFLSELSFGMSSNIWRITAIQWLLWTLIACSLSTKSKPLIKAA